jgi:hypothetical protein
MRPGGLTALAVFNFVFGGLATLTHLITLATLGTFYARMAEQAEKSGEAFPSRGTLYALSVIALVRGGLLITSGVGYLGMRRFIGWIFGNVYAVLALGSIAVEIALAPSQFTAFNLVEFAYPLITLFLLNFIFRKDFVR